MAIYEDLKKEISSSINRTFIENEYKVEYGDIWEYNEFLRNYLHLNNKYIYELKLDNNIINDKFQFLEIGKHTLDINVKTIYKYKIFKEYTKEIKQSKSYNIEVVDTNYPIISGVKDKTIMVGDNIDLKENIKAEDKIDGVLDVNIEGDVNTSKAGVYEVKVTATDKNKNMTVETFKVTVNENVYKNT